MGSYHQQRGGEHFWSVDSGLARVRRFRGGTAVLKRYYKLVILSNVDRVSFRSSNVRLKVDFDAIYTAQDIESYKPSDRNFEYMLGRLEGRFWLRQGDVLHVAQSLLHDHAPANRAALASAWIDRRHAEDGWGATMPPAGTPHYDFRFESMAAFADGA